MADLPEGFDLEALLAPIEGDAPQGIDMREASEAEYRSLRDARRDARDAERGQDAGEDSADPAPLWRSVRQLSMKHLVETTKDLELAAWLTEALVRSHGLAGITAGAELVKGLAEQYWDDLFPLPDPTYGLEDRVSPITGLNGRDGNGSLIQPINMITLFNRPDGSPVPFYMYKQSEQLGTLDAERRQARIDAGAVPLEELEREARAAGGRRFAALLADARAAHDAWQAMAGAMDERAGADGPSTTAVRDLLTGIIEVATRFAPTEAVEATAAPGEAAAEGGGEMAAAGGGGGGGGVRIAVSPGQVASREDALKALSEIANFFRKTEPHSPLSYTLDEAVRRGRMSWPELLAEVVEDMTTRNTILTSLGIRPPPPEEEATE